MDNSAARYALNKFKHLQNEDRERFNNLAIDVVDTMSKWDALQLSDRLLEQFPSNLGQGLANDRLNALARATYDYWPELRQLTRERRSLLGMLLGHAQNENYDGCSNPPTPPRPVDPSYSFWFGNPLVSNNAPEGTMHTTAIKVETVTRVTLPGSSPVDASLLSDDQLIQAIQASEKQVAALYELTTPSAAIKAKIDELSAGATALAGILDARAEKA